MGHDMMQSLLSALAHESGDVFSVGYCERKRSNPPASLVG
jgi:hypothetical protein